MKRPTVHFSNRLEILASQLGRELFDQSKDPFEKRLVLLPSHNLKLYLASFFARDPRWSICSGVTFKTLLSGAFEFFSEEELSQLPSSLALSFILEEEIEQIIRDPSLELDEIKKYMEPFSEQKRIWLATELSKLLVSYTIFEGKGFERWKERKGWKQILWQRVSPKMKVLSQELVKTKTEEIQVHLFGFSHIPSDLYEFFCRCGMHVYFLSPSPYFWEDLCSDQERIFLEKKMEGKKVCFQVQEQMKLFLREGHPLLANWGKVGKSLIRKLGDTQSYLEEEYEEPLEDPKSALNVVQEGLFQLSESKQQISFEDRSILCLSATSKLREIEVLFETIQEFFVKDPSLQPRDVVVLCSNLEEYFPYIQTVFGSQTSSIGYSAHGLSLAMAEENARALLFLLSLAESRFEKSSLLDFFSFPSVRAKLGWTAHQLDTIKKWIEKAQILWGLSPEHKKMCMDQMLPEGAFEGNVPLEGTWEEGISRLLQGLALDFENVFFEESESLSIWPTPIIDWTQTDLLGQFIEVFYSLKEDLKPIYERQEKTLDEWVCLIKKIVLSYFEKTSIEDSLIRDLEKLRENLEGKLSFSFSFQSFKRAILENFHQKKESFQSSHLNTVKFLSMELGACYPAEIICAVGLDEDSYPRKNLVSCLDDIGRSRETPCESDQDRYLFLEMILSARKAFICTYQRMSWKDQKKLGPSLLIQDLMTALDRTCFFLDRSEKPSEILIRHHPAMGIDKSYFQSESRIRSYSSDLFDFAKCYYSADKKKTKSLFLKKETVQLFPAEKISIKKLQEFAKDPLRIFFKEKLEIFFDFEPFKESEFFISPLVRNQIKKEMIEKEEPILFDLIKLKGALPLGEIGKIAICDLEEDVCRWNRNLNLLQVSKEDLFSIEFSEGVLKIEKEGKKIRMPPLEINLGDRKVFLEGSVSYVSAQGLLWMDKPSKATWIHLYPLFLIFSVVAPSLSLEKNILFLETGKKSSLEIENPLELLTFYINLYLESLEEPCPIRPEWGVDFLTKAKDERDRQRSSFLFKGFVDPYEEWIEKRAGITSFEEVDDRWKNHWAKIFSPLLNLEKV